MLYMVMLSRVAALSAVHNLQHMHLLFDRKSSEQHGDAYQHHHVSSSMRTAAAAPNPPT
jgi:hypothetical protein